MLKRFVYSPGLMKLTFQLRRHRLKQTNKQIEKNRWLQNDSAKKVTKSDGVHTLGTAQNRVSLEHSVSGAYL